MFDDLANSLKASEGIGLAAPQIGLKRRLIVLSSAFNPDGDGSLCLSNPQIVAEEGEQEGEEGCLSIPGLLVAVKRAAKIAIGYLDYQNCRRRISGDGTLAVCLQHEIDHLDGILIVDKIPPPRRQSELDKWRKSCRQSPSRS